MNISQYTNRGVVITFPESVAIDPAVNPENIAPGVVIHPGTRIRGAGTSIGPGCVIGSEAPATVENCQLGCNVSLKGGYFSDATFLDNSSMGSGAHVRTGTLLEEYASAAHSVGLKQTIFMPFVTAGSLINFCDCLMAGGTDRKNHSEIGSSYIHFNFTPRQDKATASLIGDVPRGVMLNRQPVFLGGQGGLVGPARIAFGTTIAAGTICREDVLDEDTLYLPSKPAPDRIQNYNPSLCFGIRRVLRNNIIYIGNLIALTAWYRNVRSRYSESDRYARACFEGALTRLQSGLDERIRQLDRLVHHIPHSLELADTLDDFPEDLRRQQQSLLRQWPALKENLCLEVPDDTGIQSRDLFLEEWESLQREMKYTDAVKRLSPDAGAAGTEWLQAIVDYTASLWPNSDI
ncbi:MAG: UDP-N-acetylglucosamine pyrophosphorylase [Acidobacteriota bacterium]